MRWSQASASAAVTGAADDANTRSAPAARTASALPAARAAGQSAEGNYLPGVVVLELELPVPDVPEDAPEELPAPEVPPDVLPVPLPAPEVPAEPLAPALPEPDVVSALLGVVLEPGALDELDELLLGVLDVSAGGVVVVLGDTVVEDDELLGVEPELPLLPLLQPVAATEARASAATRGIRCFMTSSPIKVNVR
jgi:hypothetical protein